ncbi:MAG TPA: alanine racemase [Dissulfurispiraceae bacterium]
MDRGITAEISLDALSRNLEAVDGLSSRRPVIAVVKADAYGHGAVEVSKRLEKAGVEYLAVAFAGEARELREAGIGAKILVLFDHDAGDIFKYQLIPVVGDRKAAAALSKEAAKAGLQAHVQIKVDTGMGRLGISGDAVKEIGEIAKLGNLHIDGVMSHFSEADLADTSFAKEQIRKFEALRGELARSGLRIRTLHIANSAAVMALPEAHFDAVRPGLMLYGYSPLSAPRASLPMLNPVLSARTRLVALRKLPAGTPVSYGRTFVTKRESLIGVMAAGYADGFDRRFSNNAEVLVRGKRVPVVGRVCMDLSMIDLTDVEGAADDDEIVIIGRQGGESMDAAELAQRAGTIPYEILTSLGSRARRVYIP